MTFTPYPFQQGKRYETLGGKWIKILEVYRSTDEIQCDDGCWRNDVTGQLLNGEAGDQRNLIPVDLHGRQAPTVLVEGIPGVNRLLAPASGNVLLQPPNQTDRRGMWDVYFLDRCENGIAHYRPNVSKPVAIKQAGMVF